MGEAQSKNVLVYDGAIFLCSRLTRRECFERKLFGLSSQCSDFIQKIKSGATLFLYDVEQRKLHGVFEATSDGAMDIIPDAFISSGNAYPSQIRFKRIWFCKPLMESEFQDALQANYFSRTRFSFGLSHQQVVNLLHLFSSRNRLQPRQNPRLHDALPRESETSSLVNQTANQSSSNSGSHCSFKSPCQTCNSSTLGEHEASLGHKLTKSMSSTHREPQPDFSDVAKSNSSKSSLHTGANTYIATGSGNKEALDDKSVDDYIPLQLEEDSVESVDDLSDLLEEESNSLESKGSSDSEDSTTFHQPCDMKKDGFHPPVVNSKLRSDNEGRTSVFSRLMGRPTSFSQRKKYNTKAPPPMNAKSFSPLPQRKNQRNKPFPCDNNRMVDVPSDNRMSRTPPLDYSFVWDYSGRSNEFSVGKPSKIQTHLGPFLREDVSKWDLCTKEPDRYDACKNLFVPKDSRKLIGSCDTELNLPPAFAEVHQSSELAVKEEVGAPFLDFKRCAKDPAAEGGDQDSDNEDIEEAARKKSRVASTSYHQEYQSDTALFPKVTEAMDVQVISGGSCQHKGTDLSSKGAFTHLANAYIETNVLLHDEQQQNNQGCYEEVTADKSLTLEDSESVDLLLPNVETRGEVASDHLENKSKMCLSFDGNDRHVASSHLVAEMPLQEKQTPSVQSCSEVVHGDNVLVPENSEEMVHKFNENSSCMDVEDSELKTPIHQKNGEVIYLLVDSEDHGDTMSPKGCQSSTPPYDHEISKAVLPPEVQCQNFQSRPEAAHENPDPTDSFAVCAEGYGSKSSMSADSTSGHQVVPDLLGTNLESRASFINGSSNECAANFSAYPFEQRDDQAPTRSWRWDEATVTTPRPQSAAAAATSDQELIHRKKQQTDSCND